MQLLLALVVVVALGAAAMFGYRLEMAGSWTFWALVTLPVVVAAGFAAWRMHRDGDLASSMRPVWGDFSRGFFGALALFAGAWLFVKVAAPAGSPRESWMARIYLQLGHPGTLRAQAPWVGLGIFIVAAAEEMVWRGLVTTLFAERFGSRYAWVFAAFAYAAARLPLVWALSDPVAGPNPILPIGALLAGLAFGAMARGFGRLPPVIVAHALFDWCVVVMFRLWGNSI